MVDQWEYKDFFWRVPEMEQVSVTVDLLTQARIEWWSESKSYIMREIQKWLDEGWEPMTQIGPDCWEMEKSSISNTSKWGPLAWMIWFIGLIATFGLAIFMLFGKTEVYKPTAFRVQMKRRKA